MRNGQTDRQLLLSKYTNLTTFKNTPYHQQMFQVSTHTELFVVWVFEIPAATSYTQTAYYKHSVRLSKAMC